MRRILFLLLIAATFGTAQTAPPFSIRTQQGATVQIIGDGGTMAFAADGIGLNADGAITVTYKPATISTTATITGIDLTGATDFSITGAPDVSNPGLTLANGVPSFGISVRFKPTTSKLTTGKLTITYTENNRPGSFSVNLAGTAPEFAFTYAVQPDSNARIIADGTTISFPDTYIDETSTAAVIITNKGSGPGVVNNISYAGDPQFVLAGLPLPPATIDANKAVQFGIKFTPDQLAPVTGTVKIDMVAGRSLSFNVKGAGLGEVYTYEVTEPGRGQLQPNGVVDLPDAVVGGDKTSVTIRVRNMGNADGVITTISVAGQSFSLLEGPFLPYTLTKGSSVNVKVQFSPTQPGRATGRLRIGDDNFELAGNGLGANLTFTYTAGGGSVQVANNGTVVFQPIPVGQTGTATFTLKNDGTAPTEVNSISATGTGTTFTLGTLPAFPVKIEPGATVPFTITFTPATVGNNSGTLRVDTQSFTLSGVASNPAPLSAYSFSGASGSVDPQQQPAIGLSLDNTYPLALTGTLTMAFNSDVFSNDPSVQFAAGGRTLNFTIAAGQQQAMFANGATQMRLQTGTVAGNIILSPTFATSGGIDLTPTNPTTATLTVPQQAPKLLSVVVSAKATNGFTLLVTGYASGRSITQMDFQFSPTANETVGTQKLTLNVEPSFTAWYQSTNSQQYGSLFTATVPFTLQGDLNKVSSLVDTIQSVAVTITNRQGVSSSQSVSLK